jgi:hypothetical protein
MRPAAVLQATARATLASCGVIAALAGAALWFCTAMPGASWRDPLPAATAEESELAQRLRQHVEAVARHEHNLDQPEALEQAARYIEATLRGYGYTVQPQEYVVDGHTVRNLEAVAAVPAVADAAQIIVGAHYDSAEGAPGANDNGSGVAATLELARRLRGWQPAPGRTLRFVLWVNEEPPYFQTEQMGSYVHAQALSGAGRRVAAALSLETLGYYSDRYGSQQYPPPFDMLYPHTGDFVAFIGALGSRSLVRQAVGSFRRHARFPSEGVAAPGFVEGVDWSDHWSYAQFGAPALMVTDTALFRYPHYHTAQDTPDQLDYARLARVVEGLDGVVRDLAGSSP